MRAGARPEPEPEPEPPSAAAAAAEEAAEAAGGEGGAWETVAAIRLEKMVGLAAPADPVLARAVEQLQATLGRALQKLANDLYASSQHFVHELVQNADDNRYAAGASPSLALEVAEAGLIVRNNEQVRQPVHPVPVPLPSLHYESEW